LVHVTVVPGETVTVAGVNWKFWMKTETRAGAGACADAGIFAGAFDTAEIAEDSGEFITAEENSDVPVAGGFPVFVGVHEQRSRPKTTKQRRKVRERIPKKGNGLSLLLSEDRGKEAKEDECGQEKHDKVDPKEENDEGEIVSFEEIADLQEDCNRERRAACQPNIITQV